MIPGLILIACLIFVMPGPLVYDWLRVKRGGKPNRCVRCNKIIIGPRWMANACYEHARPNR